MLWFILNALSGMKKSNGLPLLEVLQMFRKEVDAYPPNQNPSAPFQWVIK